MPASNPSPPSVATSSRAGLLDYLAQTIGGVKTFLAAVIASAGIQVASLFNTNGASGTDRSIVLGTNLADGSVNASARLFTVATGVGGTEVDHFRVTKGGTFIWSNGGIVASFTSGAGIKGEMNAYYAFYVSGSAAGYGSANSLRLTTESADGAAAVAGFINTTTAWSNATARLWSFRTANVEKSAIMSNGEFEHAVAGAGIVLKSPDGARWRLTVSNLGALVIAAA